jgi:hypothetical protein
VPREPGAFYLEVLANEMAPRLDHGSVTEGCHLERSERSIRVDQMRIDHAGLGVVVPGVHANSDHTPYHLERNLFVTARTLGH